MSQGIGADLDRAQSAHDAKVPPDDHNCEDGHEWVFTRSRHIGWDDVKEFKCRVCGAIAIE
jgi:hypothetical protein